MFEWSLFHMCRVKLAHKFSICAPGEDSLELYTAVGQEAVLLSRACGGVASALLETPTFAHLCKWLQYAVKNKKTTPAIS